MLAQPANKIAVAEIAMIFMKPPVAQGIIKQPCSEHNEGKSPSAQKIVSLLF
jgi:hypothetical protein